MNEINKVCSTNIHKISSKSKKNEKSQPNQ